MKAVGLRFTCVAVGLFAATAGTVVGQGVFSFSDDFNRDIWDNAQTNAFLPAWSAPGAGGFIVPSGGVPFVGEVVVNGSQVQILANGQLYLDLDLSTDPDYLGNPNLLNGSVGTMSWAERGSITGLPAGGARWQDYRVQDGDGVTVFQENWQPVLSDWKVVAPQQSDGTVSAINNVTGNFRWDFVNGAVIEDSDVFVRPTAATPTADFIGPTIAYTGAGANDWTNYRVRTRMESNDDDGFGLIVHYFEDADTISFYRVHFAGIQTDTVNRRPVRGVGVQKAVMTKSTGATVWTALLDSTAFVFDRNKPFDVDVQVENVSASETKLTVNVINDAVANPTPLAPFVVSDTTDPIQSGSVGFMAWAILVGRWSNYGGVSTPFVETLGGSPATLLGDIFSGPYNNWTPHQYANAPTGGNTNLQRWGILLLDTTDLLENSDGRQTDGVTTGGVPDGNFTPFIMYKAGFASGTAYSIRSTMKTEDNDGQGLVFGYNANGDDSYSYFRAAFRVESGSNFGFPTGISVQKVIKPNGGSPVVTMLGISLGRGTRANQAGIWIKKFATGALEQTSTANLADGSGQPGVEFQGPRLVTGDTAWTDYTFEYVSEVRDDWPFGALFRYQDELNYYRLTFNGNSTSTGAMPPNAAPTGLSIQKVVNGVYSELWKDTDPTKSGNNDVDPTAGFIYDGTQSPVGYRTWRTRVTVSGATPTVIHLAIDAIFDDPNTPEIPNYYTATITDNDTTLTHGKVGFHTFAQTANEFRDISLTLAGQATPEFVDGDGTPDAKGWEDASLATMADPAFFSGGTQGGTDGYAAGAPTSGFGIRPDLNALSIRDNRYKSGSADSVLETPGVDGKIDFDGPRAVVGKPNWKDYTYGVDLRQFDDDGIGIVYRYQDEGNFYRLMFMSQSGNTLGSPPRGVSVQKCQDGHFSELAYFGGFIYTPGQRWNVAVTATGAHFDVLITEIDAHPGVQHNFSFDDPSTPLLTGKVGVTIWGSGGAANEVNTLLGLAAPGLNWTQNFFESGVFDNVTVEGTIGRLPPDLTHDGKINGDDLVLWLQCFSGPSVLRTDNDPNCDVADEDFDGDIDNEDFAWFQKCFSGIANLDPQCVE